MDAERLARNLSIEPFPELWKTNWQAFEEWEASGGCEAEMGAIPSDAADLFDIPPECMGDLEAVCSEIRLSADLQELARLWHFLLFHQPSTRALAENAMPAPTAVLGERAPLLHIAVLVSGTEHALQACRDSGVSDRIALDSLHQCGSQMRDHHERYGVYGMRFLGWMRNYFNAMMFRLGRLVFNPNQYSWPFRVYRHRISGELTTLLESGRMYRTDGIADGTNGIHDSDAWMSVLRIRPEYVRGHPALPDARASRERIELPTSEWELLITPGDQMIEVHIPGQSSGGRLAWEECAESYRQAVEFFARHYQDTTFTCFTCWSWLLDPQLALILSPGSNIVRFQSTFHLLPVVGSDAQCYDLAFGSGAGFDVADHVPKTSLQQAIRDYVLAGNRMRSAAGFMTIEEVEDLAGTH